MYKLQLNFTAAELDALPNTVINSFVTEQPDRFRSIEPSKWDAVVTIESIRMNPVPGTLFYFDSLLECKIFEAGYHQINKREQCYVLVDDLARFHHASEYCCWTEDDFESYESIQCAWSLDVSIDKHEKEFMGES